MQPCAKITGHTFVATEIANSSLTLTLSDSLRWYRSSRHARRGFCSTCVSTLFWELIAGERVDVAIGAFDGPTGTHLKSHIFIADKCDDYDIVEGLL